MYFVKLFPARRTRRMVWKSTKPLFPWQQAHDRVLDTFPESRGQRPRTWLANHMQCAMLVGNAIVRRAVLHALEMQADGGFAHPHPFQTDLRQPRGEMWISEQHV